MEEQEESYEEEEYEEEGFDWLGSADEYFC